jgi:hypothetical protein
MQWRMPQSDNVFCVESIVVSGKHDTVSTAIFISWYSMYWDKVNQLAGALQMRPTVENARCVGKACLYFVMTCD